MWQCMSASATYAPLGWCAPPHVLCGTPHVQAATYNAAGHRPPPDLDLGPWLRAQATGGTAPPDVLVIAWQEIVPLNAGSVIGGKGDFHSCMQSSNGHLFGVPSSVRLNTQACVLPLPGGAVVGATHAMEWDARLAAHLNGNEW